MANRGAVHGARQRGNSGPRAHLDPTTTKVRATANLPVDLDAKLRRAADATGMTMSAYICALVARDVLDDSGTQTRARTAA
jgi:hypothetical protein